ncbi:hypothetical protein V8F33_008828 [Rhypophila sp. PSN 637]
MNYSVEATMNSWEVPSYQSTSAYDGGVFHDSLYAPSQYNIMQILIKVMERPNPKVQLGPVDMSCPILVCDLQLADQPIIYASEPFYQLTGYTPEEVIGSNCRFLQAPGGKIKAKSTRKYVDKECVRKMRKAVDKCSELQIEVVNFKKNGSKFVNYLTMIPVRCDGRDYCVGFLTELES